MNQSQTFVVQMMRPPASPQIYDVIAAPFHDRLVAQENTVTTVGAPNRITPERLAAAEKEWRPAFAHLPSPLFAVMIGGTTKRFDFSEKVAANFMDQLIAFVKKRKSSLLVSTSRRTDENVIRIISEKLSQSNLPHHLWTGEGDNPYMGYLSLADEVIVTADSVSMVSEACTAGKPVYVYGLGQKSLGKFNMFYEVLRRQKRVCSFGENVSLKTPEQPLSDTALVAGFTRGRLIQHLLQQQKSP